MATLLTSVLTPFGSESCTSCSSEGSVEALWEEGVTDERGGSEGSAIRLDSFDCVSPAALEPGQPATHLLGSGYHARLFRRTIC